MPNSWKGIIGGFVATVVISLIFWVLNAVGIMQDLDIVTLIDHLGSIGRGGAWADHFIVGTLLWGPIFTGIDSMTNPAPRWKKGLIFSLGAWFLMMIIFMPVVGGGLFGLNFGAQVAVWMLAIHLIYGFVLGAVFDVLDARFPARDLFLSGPPKLGN